MSSSPSVKVDIHGRRYGTPPGFPNYIVYENGRVRDTYRGVEYSPYDNLRFITLRDTEGWWKRLSYGRVVYEAFYGPLQPGQCLRYENGNRRDVRLSNLYVTGKGTGKGKGRVRNWETDGRVWRGVQKPDDA